MAHSSANSREVRISLAVLTVVVLLALAGLAAEGNWPKVERVAASFAAYTATVLIVRRLERPKQDVPSFWVFALAGAVAGIVSGVVRDEVRASIVAVGAIAAGLLLGGVHWFALRSWRRLRSALTSGRSRSSQGGRTASALEEFDRHR